MAVILHNLLIFQLEICLSGKRLSDNTKEIYFFATNTKGINNIIAI